MTEDRQEDITQTGLPGIVKALGGGAGIAAIIAAAFQISKPNIELPPNPLPVNPVPLQSVTSSASDVKQLTGIWRGNNDWGNVNLQQEGAEIHGSYSYDNNEGTTYYGYIKGDLTGTALNFTWWEDQTVNSEYEPAERGGYGYLVFNGDNQLVGKWRSQGNADWTDDIVLTKKYPDR